MPWFGMRRGGYRFLPGLTRLADPVVTRSLARLPPGARIADLGAGGRRITPDTVTVDGFATENTDVVADVHAVPLPDASFDAVFCTGTLKHVEDPPRVFAEIRRLLKPAGIAHLEVPFLQPFHADPFDYWRWTLSGLELLCTRAGFRRIEAGVRLGPGSSVAWIANEWVQACLGDGKATAVAAALARFATWHLPLRDGRLVRAGRGARASGVYFVGER